MTDFSADPKSLLWVAKLQRNFAYLQSKQKEHIAEVEKRLVAVEAKASDADTKARNSEVLANRTADLKGEKLLQLNLIKSVEHNQDRCFEKLDAADRAIRSLKKMIGEQRTAFGQQNAIALAKIVSTEQVVTELSNRCNIMVEEWKQTARAVYHLQQQIGSLQTGMGSLEEGDLPIAGPCSEILSHEGLCTTDSTSLVIAEGFDTQVVPSIRLVQAISKGELDSEKCSRCFSKGLSCNGQRPCYVCKTAHVKCYDRSMRNTRANKKCSVFGREKQLSGVQAHILHEQDDRIFDDNRSKYHARRQGASISASISGEIQNLNDGKGPILQDDGDISAKSDGGVLRGAQDVRQGNSDLSAMHRSPGSEVQIQKQPVIFPAKAVSALGTLRKKRKRVVREMPLSPA